MSDIDNFLNGFSLVGIPAIILLPFVIEGLKRLGMPTHWSGIASIVCAGLIGALIFTVNTWPAMAPLVRIVVMIILLGLSAPGVYSQAQLLTRGNPKYPDQTKK